MRVTNVSHHPIGFAIKSNAIPRLLAEPASGLLQPEESVVIAVSVQVVFH